MCMIVNQLYRQLLKNISSSVKSYADNMVKNSIWKWYQKAIQVVILQKATGSSYALCCLLTLYLYKLSVLVNLSYQHHLFSIFRCACSQPAYCWEKCIHTDCSRVSQLWIHFFVIAILCGCLSQQEEGLKGTRLHAHLKLDQRLSAVSYLLCVAEIIV